MSANAARPTVLPMIGIRYSKFPSNWVSPPIEVNERGKLATLLPDDSGKDADVGYCRRHSGNRHRQGQIRFEATTTFCEVMNVSSGAIGLIERTL